MALQDSGPLRITQISNEFGIGAKRSLGDYRVRQTVGDMTLSLDEGIPMRTEGSEPDTTTEIRFSQFYNKRLNVVVLYDEDIVADPNSSNEDERIKRVDGAHNIYSSNRELNNGIVNTISPDPSFTAPENGSGSKITLHVTKKLGSNKDSRKNFDPDNTGTHRSALRTGNPSYWNKSDVTPIMHINIGPNAIVSGAGGNGGKGGRTFDVNDGNGQPGEVGSSAIGIAFPVEKITIQEGGVVQAGCGGGGGGGAAAGELSETDERVGGAGGGGGAGLPGGIAGKAGSDANTTDGTSTNEGYKNVEHQPQDGGNGSQTSGGGGGKGGANNEQNSDNTPTAQSGGGGGGGGQTVGEGGGFFNLGESSNVTGFTIRWSGTFVQPGDPPTRDPNGSEARSGTGAGHSFEWAPNASANTALRDATLGWESTSDSPIVQNNVEMLNHPSGSGSNFKVDIKYSPYQKNEDEGTSIFQTAIEITRIANQGNGYSEGDALTTQYWIDNALSPDGAEANRRIINVSEVESVAISGNGSAGNGSVNSFITNISNNDGKGGNGGNGDAEGSGQDTGSGGAGGLGGYAIITKDVDLPDIIGTGIIGRIEKGDSEIVI